MRWAVRVTLVVVAFVIVAGAVVVGAVHTSWGRNVIRKQIVAELQSDFPGSTIEAFEGSPFGTLVLRGVTLNAKDGKPLVTVERIEVDAALGPLFRKRVFVNSVRVTGVGVFVREQPPEPPNYIEGQAESKPTTWSIEAPDITVDGVRVTIDTQTGPETIEPLALRASAWMPAGKPLAAMVSAHGVWRGTSITAIAAAGQHGNVVTVPLLALTLGDARLAGYAISIIDESKITGVLDVSIPTALVKALGGPVLPGDVAFTADAREGGRIAVAGTLGTARFDANVVGELRGKHAHAVLVADARELAPLTGGELIGAGSVVIAVDATAKRLRGILSALGEAEGAPPMSTLVAFDATLAEISLVASARAGRLAGMMAGATTTAVARIDVSADGSTYTLGEATVLAQVDDVTDMRGKLTGSLTASGQLWPVQTIAVRGALDARDVRREEMRVGAAHVALSGTVTSADAVMTATVDVTDIRSGETRIPSVALAADVTTDAAGVIAVALGAHRVRTVDGTMWSGRGGRITMTEQTITVDEVRTGTGKSTVTASARIDRIDESLSAKVTARNVALAIADPTLRGEADLDLDVSQRGGRWSGHGVVTARGAGVPVHPVVDATADLRITGRKLAISGTVENREIGSTSFALAVTGPRDLTDVEAWQRLPRAALDNLTITIASIDASTLGGAGRIAGEIVIGPTDVRGDVRVRGVETKLGMADGDISLRPAGNDTRISASGTVAGLPPVTLGATLAIPARPFDPRAWLALGPAALRDATLDAEGIAVDPTLVARLGFAAPYSATVDAHVDADLAARTATLTVDVKRITGGKLTAPVDVRLVGKTTRSGSTLDITAGSGRVQVTAVGTSSLTIDRVLAQQVDGQTIGGTLTIPSVAARDMLGLFGRTDVFGGTVGGTVTVAGTVGAPVVHALMTARNLAVTSTLSGKSPPVLDILEVDARLVGKRVQLEVTGKEAGNRLLKISANGTGELNTIVASIEAANFDLAPLAAFAPGELRGARGILSGVLKIRGLDPQTGDVRGKLLIRDGRLPLSPELGTLRRASLDIEVIKQKIVATLDGRLGAGGGTVKGTVTAQLEGGMPIEAKLDATLRKVQPIGALQPQVDADITGNFVNEGPRWAGKIVVANAKVYVPPEGGNDLLGAGAPADMHFVDSSALVVKKARRLPTKPWLVTKVVIGRTSVEIEDTDFRVRLIAKGLLNVEVGDGIGITGAITTERGNVDVLGRRYRLEQAVIDFDGLPDPRLDLRLVHDFKNLTLTVDVRGRASDPDLRLSGDPGTYTQGQLLSFFAGAEPGNDDSSAQANQAVVGGSLTILSSRLGRRLNKHLPVKFDTINYEAGTTTSSRAVRFGLRLSERSYLLWRQRLEARPDENPGEIVFEYQLRPNALFETTVGERATGADLLLRTRW